MDRKQLDQRLPDAVAALVASVQGDPRMRHLGQVQLPNRDQIVAALETLRLLIFPGYFGKQDLTEQTLPARISELAAQLLDPLYQQVRCCLRYRENLDSEQKNGKCSECDAMAAEIVAIFFDSLPTVRELLASDVQAAFDSDPAARSTDETIFCYPGIFAIFVQRVAHEFYELDVPLLPRIMTEYAHSLTGIDIHPGAKLGPSFFIDHGTGVVIGETTEIGSNVKIYQGVTLGALAPHFGQMLRGQKRHPTIEDDVIIYAGATILGGDTVIGRGSIIGGNVFITSSVPAQNQVIAEPPKLQYRQKGKRKKMAEAELDFQI
ncbi:MAG TPA: serine O-acetyltransferase EpsC [Tepidisphaeraceae bacterium]|jgi:serine O-acetyltransferase